MEEATATTPRVSVVVPVYNGALFLEECLTSIAAQTYRDWEAVIVNNCSTDATAQIADAFAVRDPRFRAVHCTEFIPKTDNYNRAIASASKGVEFVKVVEADNTLRPECIERMVELADSDPEIGIAGAYYTQGRMLLGGGMEPGRTVIAGKDVLRDHLFTNLYYMGVPTTLLFRAKALAEITPHFRADVFFDDVELCFRILAKWKFGVVDQVLAFVRDDNNGLYGLIRKFDDVVAFRYASAVLFGKSVLSPEEFARTIALRKRDYFECIGRAVIGVRSPKYWEFHRSVFRLLGKDLNFQTLTWPTLLSVFDMVFNPKKTIERILGHRFGFVSKLGRFSARVFGRFWAPLNKVSELRTTRFSSSPR